MQYADSTNTNLKPIIINRVAKAGRKKCSGILALKWLPTHIPGTEPSNKLPSNCTSKLPKLKWPKPATAVNGIACAKSVPTTFKVLIRGYKNNKATVPKAPAPTEDKVTSTPRTAPVNTVAIFSHFGEKRP